MTSFTCSFPFESSGTCLPRPDPSGRSKRSLSRPPRPPRSKTPTAQRGSSVPPHSRPFPRHWWLCPYKLLSLLPLAPPPEAERAAGSRGLWERAGAGACARTPNAVGGEWGRLHPPRPGEPRVSDPFLRRPPDSSPFGIRFPCGAGAAASTQGRYKEAREGRRRPASPRAAGVTTTEASEPRVRGAARTPSPGGHGLSARRVRGGVGVGARSRTRVTSALLRGLEPEP